ncbi:MAG: putative toxin-antitoxin system toxin component, PIN family [Chloroflexi bacterium]|nr:putative toxin-antitoxin system toxin component, PIN family [Chloroflexota bacterium]
MPIVVLVDTNVWVSAFINPAGFPARLHRAWLDNRFQVVVSLPLLDELSEVLTRPRITRKYSIQASDVEELLQLMIRRSHIIVPTGSVRECRDPDDDLILETAILGQAQYAVSRDDDIKRDLDLIKHLDAHGVTVLSVQQFLIKLDAGEI